MEVIRSCDSPAVHIPDHELIQRVGAGSYGEVWLARNVLGELRAVKIIARDRFTEPRPFEREFEGIQRFEPISRLHPSQLAILHVGKNDDAGCFYYVMELADAAGSLESVAPSPSSSCEEPSTASRSRGSSPPILRDYLAHTLRHDLDRCGRLPLPDCLRIGLSLATAMAHLHRHGLVHRDVKPSNVIFVNGVPKLGDIGLVTEAGDTQSIVGTEGYIPPEGPGTPKADIFSLGKVLYEISTGMDRRHFPELPVDLRSWPDRTAVVEFNEIVLRACAKDAANRYASAEVLHDDLACLLSGKSVKRRRSWRRMGHALSRGAMMSGVVLVCWAAWRVMGKPKPEFAARATVPGYRYNDMQPTTNSAAYEAFMTAETLMRSGVRERVLQSKEYMEQAVRLDPNWAEAHCLKAANLTFLVENGLMRGSEAWREFEASARRAAEMAPHALWPRRLLTSLRQYARYEWAEAERELLDYARRQGDVEAVHTSYSTLLSCLGRHDESLQRMRHAIEMNPASVSTRASLGWKLFFARNYHNALEQFDRALVLDSNSQGARVGRCNVLARLGRGDESMREASSLWREHSDNIEAQCLFGLLHALAGRHGEANEALAKINVSTNDFRRPFLAAVLLANLNKPERALDELEQCYEDRFLFSLNLAVDPGFDALRDHPRFARLLEKMRLDEVPGAIRR